MLWFKDGESMDRIRTIVAQKSDCQTNVQNIAKRWRLPIPTLPQYKQQLLERL
jgi:hypothetical protein